MKKVFILTLGFMMAFAVSAYAAQITTGQSASCKDAQSIDLEVAKIQSQHNDKFGYTTNDRGGANLVIWKSSNFTTIPITLGPNDNNAAVKGKDKGRANVSDRFYTGLEGKSKVTLKHQPAFSRGDSIGDISGLVKITNTGTNPVSVTCN